MTSLFGFGGSIKVSSDRIGASLGPFDPIIILWYDSKDSGISDAAGRESQALSCIVNEVIAGCLMLQVGKASILGIYFKENDLFRDRVEEYYGFGYQDQGSSTASCTE